MSPLLPPVPGIPGTPSSPAGPGLPWRDDKACMWEFANQDTRSTARKHDGHTYIWSFWTRKSWDTRSTRFPLVKRVIHVKNWASIIRPMLHRNYYATYLWSWGARRSVRATWSWCPLYKNYCWGFEHSAVHDIVPCLIDQRLKCIYQCWVSGAKWLSKYISIPCDRYTIMSVHFLHYTHTEGYTLKHNNSFTIHTGFPSPPPSPGLPVIPIAPCSMHPCIYMWHMVLCTYNNKT